MPFGFLAEIEESAFAEILEITRFQSDTPRVFSRSTIRGHKLRPLFCDSTPR